jgi:hypothetical protein
MRRTTVVSLLGAFFLGVATAACVRIPPAVQDQFAPAQPRENSYFRRQLDAPSPFGYVTESDLAQKRAATVLLDGTPDEPCRSDMPWLSGEPGSSGKPPAPNAPGGVARCQEETPR